MLGFNVFLRKDVIELQQPTWGTPDNSVPPDTPACGFLGEFCQEDSMYLSAYCFFFNNFQALFTVCASFLHLLKTLLETLVSRMDELREYIEYTCTRTSI